MAREWSSCHQNRNNQTTREDREASITALAGLQKQILRVEQLREIGFSRQAVSRRVASRRLFTIHRGVFALHPPPYSRDQLRVAAVFATGPDSLISNWESASLQGLADLQPPLIAVCNPTGKGRSCPTLQVHRSAVDPRDRRIFRGIPCTSADRTILDVAPTASVAALEDLLLAADSKGLLKRPRFEALLSERYGMPGTRKTLDLINDDPVVTRSENERRVSSTSPAARSGTADPRRDEGWRPCRRAAPIPSTRADRLAPER